MSEIFNSKVDRVMLDTAYAYSRSRYADWRACAIMLLDEFDYSVPQAVEILNSKWTRWAADLYGDGVYGAEPVGCLFRFVQEERARGNILP